MATLTNTKIKDTYKSLLKVSDNGNLEAGLQEITDGEGNLSGVQLNTGGDLTASGTVAFGSLKDSGENITIAKFVDEADGIAGNDNDTSIPTSAAVKDYVDTKVTAEDLDFAGDSGTGAVDLDSQTFTIAGTANEIETSASGQTITIGLPNNVNVSGNLAVDTNTLYVDAADNRVGIGTSTPDAKFTLLDGATFFKIYQDSTNEMMLTVDTGERMLFGIGGIEKMRIDNAGNVGIGTSSPNAELEIASSAPQVRLTDTDGGYCDIANIGGNLFFQADKGNTEANSTMRFEIDGDEKMRIDSSGNVGIGTSSPAYPLEIDGGTNNIIARFLSTDTHARIQFTDDTTSGQVSVGAQGDDFVAYTSGLERMRITSTGTLDLSANNNLAVPPTNVLRFTDTDTACSNDQAQGAIEFYTSDNTSTGVASAIKGLTGSGGAAVGRLVFETAGTEKMRIDSSGNVGIGTSSPAVKLDVVGQVRASTGILFGSDTAAANALDDYEEGTWTPTDGSGAGLTFLNVDAKYTKIGKMVYAIASFDFPSTADISTASIDGLPFTLGSTTGNIGGFITYSTVAAAVQFRPGNNSTSGTIRNGTGTSQTNAILSTGSFTINALYFV